MKYDMTAKAFLFVLNKMIKKDVEKKNIKLIKKEYKAIILRSKSIGKKNILLSSYLLCAFFIALNRKNPIGADENYLILEHGMKESKLLKLFMGDASSYFDSKRMEARKKWALNSHHKKYENDWVLNFIEKDSKYEFGIDYLECGVCKMCKAEGCFELAKYLCKLDYLLADIMGLGLDRTKTLANGSDCCDFRWYRK